ncbi:MAG: ERCC4 domain-containing protein [Candidatus Bilamarchaeum sp.]|jgi:Fanconi anemia group M protein
MQQFLEGPILLKPLISVDMRESEEFDRLLKSFGADIDRRVLDVADFLCSSKLAIERKTRSDFESSIIDGRLFSQLPNLIQNYERVVVIVEGTNDEGRISRSALLGAYATVMSDYGASLIFTKNMEATAELVYNIAKHEQLAKKNPMRIYAKRKALTTSQAARAIVETLPNVGPKLAKKLISHFGSAAAVFSASEKELTQIEGVGQKKARSIRLTLDYLYSGEEDGSVY